MLLQLTVEKLARTHAWVHERYIMTNQRLTFLWPIVNYPSNAVYKRVQYDSISFRNSLASLSSFFNGKHYLSAPKQTVVRIDWATERTARHECYSNQHTVGD